VVKLDEAYSACERIARRHYENFPVASLLLPAAMRPHIAAIYAFARAADDFADEGDRSQAERLALLDGWGSRLTACIGIGSAARPNPEPRVPSPGHATPNPEADAIFLALGHTIRSCALPVGLFEDLLAAFRQDVVTTRYAAWADVMDYCRRSANPVGRLVLRVAGHSDGRMDGASDAVCTALQLTNFWQDLDRDWQKGRLYVPRDDYERAGAREIDLATRTLSPAWRSVLSEMAARTRALFAEGRAVCDGVAGRLRYELRLTWLGGMRILDRLERSGYDVFSARPGLGLPDIPSLLWGAAAWGRTRPA
jgi:phytoene synthase